ncbi:phage tail fiber protein [Rhodococcus aetherivorans]|uniref:Phage tail fiber protein n=1 Tax=Rhodococcus aetherivorans TaxID=191292 RepID=A0ABQ0YQ11_9NOCA|nr:hypothetical protein [Rhodococcus aetherivorans]ETT25272.1 hypothetical protein RR21198_4012 [Rhodococcus rhodochrous ATCC 21198]NGP28455.1 hypothetical protein [Rhodococcus aetherivorans]GES38680.1 phage tail fiber protein [Rhodococcus aetherivorans]
MAWRVANSLVRLRDQVNAAYPHRSKASDGTIGDPAHQAEGSGSDHNPNRHGVVCAFDITHDPANGLDIVALAEALASSRDPRIKYLIRNRQIMVPADYGWRWVAYSGSNPHTSHLHVSVHGNYDDASNWNINAAASAGDEEMSPEVIDLAWQIGFNRQATPPDIKEFENKTVKELLQHILKYNLPQRTQYSEFNNVAEALKRSDAEVERLRAELASKTAPATAVIELKPGLYEVK